MARKRRKRSRKKRMLRGFLALSAMIMLCLWGSSVFMRRLVIYKIHERNLEESSLILSRAFPLHLDQQVNAVKLFDRLARLQYSKVDLNTLELQPGQYQETPDGIRIHLRSFISADTGNVPSKLIDIAINAGSIQTLYDRKAQRNLSQVSLEPEQLSILGSEGSRINSQLTLSSYPKSLIRAILSIEDERFYYHFGIDPIGITRAIFTNIRRGAFVQGGSTLTQQLAKNLFFNSWPGVLRKPFEAISAVLIELGFSKDQILEFYLNEVFLGQEGNTAIHGFQQASRYFFNKQAPELSLAEAALLAGLVKGPTRYSPRRHLERAVQRRNLVLQKMLELEKISKSEYDQSVRQKTVIAKNTNFASPAPYFLDYLKKSVRDYLGDILNTKNPLKIYTGLDREYQNCAEQALSSTLIQLEKAYPHLGKHKLPAQAALVSVVPQTGEIRAWVGGRDYAKNQFDHVNLASRQPGSTFKPFVYLTALDRKLNQYRVARTTSLLSDEPTTINIPGSGPWSPANYDHKYRGDVTLRFALMHSLNLPTIYLAQKIGIDAIAQTAAAFGFGTNLPRVPALALGAGEISPLRLIHAYAALANGGTAVTLRPVLAVADGEQLSHRAAISETQLASPAAVYVLTTILQDAVNSGTGDVIRSMGYQGDAAGKTGTTNDLRDAWFAGFTPNLATVVWLGFDDNTPLRLTGAKAAAPIWASYMLCVKGLEPEGRFIPPPGVTFKEVDSQSGMLATEDCEQESVVTEVFVEGTEPVTECRLHGGRGGRDYEGDDHGDFGSNQALHRRSWLDRLLGN
ncbi:PBP1A family penicillin-binding protein [bacterium]|nr:PBP1A family penicillin-binding protein [bacterium]